MAAAHPFGVFVGCRFKRIGCIRRIKVKAASSFCFTLYRTVIFWVGYCGDIVLDVLSGLLWLQCAGCAEWVAVATLCWMCWVGCCGHSVLDVHLGGTWFVYLQVTEYPSCFLGGREVLFVNALKETMTASFQILANCIQSSSHFMPFCIVVEVINHINKSVNSPFRSSATR